MQQLKIPDRTKKELKAQIKLMDIEIRDKYSFEHIVDLIDCVQSGYTRLKDLMINDHSPLADVPVDMRDAVMDFFERVLMTKNHKLLFSPPFSMDEEHDSVVQKRIRQLSWINAKHLDCTIDEANAEVRDLVYNSITGEMDFLNSESCNTQSVCPSSAPQNSSPSIRSHRRRRSSTALCAAAAASSRC